jgi:hypothetical protein
MDPLNIGAVILFGLLAVGWLFQPARDQQVVIIREPAQASFRGSGCGTLLISCFLGLLLLLLLFGHR